jgi:hypothetical protein
MARATPLRILAALVGAVFLWRTGWLQAALLSPLTVLTGAWSLLFAARPEDSDSITAAIFNVTTDYKKVAKLVEDFMHSPGIDPELEVHFRTFLARQRIRSFPKLETTLDWLLQLYWVFLPALVFSMLCNVMAKRQPAASESGDDSPGNSPTYPTTAHSPSFRRSSGGQRLAVARRPSSGSLGGGSLSRPPSSSGLTRGLSGTDIVPVPLGGSSGGGSGSGPLGGAASGARKMF